VKNKLIIGIVSGLLILGGAFAVGASKNETQLEDNTTVTAGDLQSIPEIKEGQEVELETEHGETFYKVESNDNSNNSSNSSDTNTAISITEAVKIATSEVNGKLTKSEKEMEHGRLIYKFEIQTDRGEADVRVDAETGKITRVKFDNDDSDDKFDDDNKDEDKNDDKGRGNDDSGVDG
jgi:uncharacterized membrane protein YkoI